LLFLPASGLNLAAILKIPPIGSRKTIVKESLFLRQSGGLCQFIPTRASNPSIF